ncbi:hypothetical protein SI65_09278 [Aspergillus cristatus]|uniref:gamma-glutamylcyclotransferase n=1 Tax=Aspergillus cristatus TaxID=573508 RepID=A0A1E3B326_ASPCR|nr:hypothetical protein SI65_09278 [Aspergillus cristatus]
MFARRQASMTVHSLELARSSEKVLGLCDDLENGTQQSPEQTVLYLAYGSNMASKTFLGNRGIKPISLINVYVPELRLTFDLAGVPYQEPCFASTRYRPGHGSSGNTDKVEEDMCEKALLWRQGYDDERNAWHKPLIGVVYEVTLKDYAWIIATEAGGRGYNDRIVTCYPFPETYNPADDVPEHPSTQPFKAHCLLSLIADDDDYAAHGDISLLRNPRIRPDPSYAQPSKRYIDILNAGAVENNLPFSYRAYLSQIPSYRVTTTRQRIGKSIFLSIWGPLFVFVTYLTMKYAKPDGYSPRWLTVISTIVHGCMWACYDLIFARVFGDGERTIGD